MINYNIEEEEERDESRQVDTSQINFEIIEAQNIEQVSVEPIINNLDFAFSRDKSPQYSAIGVKVSSDITRDLILDLDTQKPIQNQINSNILDNKVKQQKENLVKKKEKFEIQKVKVKKQEKILNCYKEHSEQIQALQFELQELKTILKSAQIDDEITNSQIENFQPNYFVLQQDSQQQLPLEISAPNFSRINRSIERQIIFGNRNNDESNQNNTQKANGYFDRNDLRTLQLRTPFINNNSQNLIKKKRNSNSDKVKKEKDIISENAEELNLNQSPQHPATNLGISNQNCMSQGDFPTSNPILIQRTVGQRAVSSNATTMFVANNKKPLKINQKSCILMHHYPSQNILAGYNGIEILKSHRSNISQNRKRNGQLIGRRGATSSNDRQPEYLSKSIQNNIFNQKLIEKTKNTLDNNQYQNIKDNKFESLNNIYIKRSFQNEESQDQLKLKNYFSQQQIEKQLTCNQKPCSNNICQDDLVQTALQQNSSDHAHNLNGIQHISKTEDEQQLKKQRQKNQSQEINDEVNINRVQTDIIQGIQNNEWANFGQPISIGKLFNLSQMNYNQLGGAITSRSPKESKIQMEQNKFQKQSDTQGLHTIQENVNLKLEELVPDQITEINKDQSSYISSAVAYQYTRKNGYTSLTHRNLTVNGNKKVNLIQNNFFYNNQQIKVQQDRFQQSPTCFSNKINTNNQNHNNYQKSNFNQNIIIQIAYEKTKRIQQQLKAYIQILNQNTKKQNMKQKKQIKILKQQPIDFDIQSSIDECLSIKQFLSAESIDLNMRVQKKQKKHQISCSSICISQEEAEKQIKNGKYKIKENEMKNISNEINARKKQSLYLKKNQQKQEKGIKFDSDLFPYKINLKNIQKNQNQQNAYPILEKVNFLENSKNNRFSNLSGIEMKCGEYGFLNQEIYGQESHIVLSNNDLIQQESNQTNQTPFMTINNDESDNMLNVARQDARVIISGEEDLTENENYYNHQNFRGNNHSQKQKKNYQEQTENIFFGIRGDQDFNQLSFNNSSSATFLNNSDNQIVDERLSQTDKLNIGHFDINFQKNMNTPTRIFSQQQSKEAKLSNQPSGAFFRPVMLSSSRFKNLKEASNSSAMTPSQKKKNIQTLYENLNRLSPVQHKLQSQEGDDIVDHFNQAKISEKNLTPSQQQMIVSGKDEDEDETKEHQIQLGASRSRTEKSQQIGYYTTLNNQNLENENEFQQEANLQIILTQAKSEILNSQINQPPSQINQEESKIKTNIFDEEDKQLLYITNKFENVFQEKYYLEKKLQLKSLKKNQIIQKEQKNDHINTLINQNQGKIKIITNSDKQVKIPILNLGKVVDSQCNQQMFMLPEVSTVQASQALIIGSQGNDADDICGITVTDDFFANCSVNSPLSKSGQKVACQQSDSNIKTVPNQIWNQIINDDMTIGSIGEIGFHNVEFKQNFKNKNADNKVVRSFKNLEPNFNENFSIILNKQQLNNKIQREDHKVSKSLSRLIKLKASDQKERANHLLNSPLSSIADKSIQFQKSISRSIQKQHINVEPCIFEMNPNERDEVQDEHQKIESRKSLRQKSHKKQSKSQTYQIDFKQQNNQVKQKGENAKFNKIRKKQNVQTKKDSQIENENIKNPKDLETNNQHQKNILKREIEIQYYGHVQQAKTQRPNKNIQNNQYKIPDKIFNDLVQDQQQLFTTDNQSSKNLQKYVNQVSQRGDTKGSVKQAQKVISPLTLQIKKTYIKPKPEQPEFIEENSKQNINLENNNQISMSNKQLSHKTQRLHVKHQRLFGIHRNQSSTPRRNMVNFGIQINQQNIKINPQLQLNRNTNPLPLPPYKNITKNEKDYQNGAFNTIDQTENVGYYQNQVNLLNSARNYDMKNNLNSARISCQSSRKSLGQSTKRSDQKLSARLGQRSTATLIHSNSASRFKQKNSVQKKENTPTSQINQKLIDLQKTLSDVNEKQNQEIINCQTIKIESEISKLQQIGRHKEMFQTAEKNVDNQELKQNQEKKLKETLDQNYKSMSARIVKLPLSKKNRYLQQKQDPKLVIDSQNIEFIKQSLKQSQNADAKQNLQENKINFQKNDFDELKLSSINANEEENYKSFKIISDTIASGQTEMKKNIALKDINRQNLQINQQLIQQKLQGMQKDQKMIKTDVQKISHVPQINLEGFSDEKNKHFIDLLFPQSCKNDIKQSNQLLKFQQKSTKINMKNDNQQALKQKLPNLKIQNYENVGILNVQESAYQKQKKRLKMNSEKPLNNNEIVNLQIQNQNEYHFQPSSKNQQVLNNEMFIFNNLSGKKDKHSGQFDTLKMTSSYNENQLNQKPSLSISQNSSQKEDLENLSLKNLQQKIVIKSPSTIFQVPSQKRNLGLNINKSNRAQLSCEGQKKSINIKIKPSQITPSNKINDSSQIQNQLNWQKQFVRMKEEESNVQQRQEDTQRTLKGSKDENQNLKKFNQKIFMKIKNDVQKDNYLSQNEISDKNNENSAKYSQIQSFGMIV